MRLGTDMSLHCRNTQTGKESSPSQTIMRGEFVPTASYVERELMFNSQNYSFKQGHTCPPGNLRL